MFREQDIRKALDGTVTHISQNFVTGEVKAVAKTVPLDFIPDHTPRMAPSGPMKNKPVGRPGRRWTLELDAWLVRLRRQGLSRGACARTMSISESSVSGRLKTLGEVKGVWS